MPNSAVINEDNVIEEVYAGKQTFERVTKINAKVMVLADRLRSKRLPVRVMVNIENVTGVTADSLLAASDALNTITKSKIAIYGGTKLLNDLANLVIIAVGRERSVMVFDKKKDAFDWLVSSEKNSR